MSTNFFSLPRELRDQIYKLVLSHQKPIDPFYTYYQPMMLTAQIFRVSKNVHQEASSLFYSWNRFDFTMGTQEEIASFFGQIGRVNAGYIRNVYVNFPEFFNLEPGNVTLKDDSLGILVNIQRACANLSTLTTSLYSTNERELELDALDNPKVTIEALKLVKTHFNAISSLEEIIVEVYQDGPSDHIRKEMEGHGWKISTTKCLEVEDFDRDLDYFEGNDYMYDSYSDDDDYDDTYDIDNDSDFWRRAAD